MGYEVNPDTTGFALYSTTNNEAQAKKSAIKVHSVPCKATKHQQRLWLIIYDFHSCTEQINLPMELHVPDVGKDAKVTFVLQQATKKKAAHLTISYDKKHIGYIYASRILPMAQRSTQMRNLYKSLRSLTDSQPNQ